MQYGNVPLGEALNPYCIGTWPHEPFPHHFLNVLLPAPSPDVLMFETDDLVLRKNEKNFVLCLLEVARRASRFGMAAPVLIQLEQEIEEEIREELELPLEETPPLAKPQRRTSNTQNLDEMVRLHRWNQFTNWNQ